jgi:hypothetical protein
MDIDIFRFWKKSYFLRTLPPLYLVDAGFRLPAARIRASPVTAHKFGMAHEN